MQSRQMPCRLGSRLSRARRPATQLRSMCGVCRFVGVCGSVFSASGLRSIRRLGRMDRVSEKAVDSSLGSCPMNCRPSKHPLNRLCLASKLKEGGWPIGPVAQSEEKHGAARLLAEGQRQNDTKTNFSNNSNMNYLSARALRSVGKRRDDWGVTARLVRCGRSRDRSS